jgi:two-component system sensor histidine kinase/response regulator
MDLTSRFEISEVLARVVPQLQLSQLSQQLARQNQELKQQNDLLIREIEQRKQAEQALELFLHTVTHDLRNPLIGWSMMLQSLLSQEQSEYVIERQVLETMEKICVRQQQLIEMLVQVPTLKKEVVELTIVRQPLSLWQLVNEFLLEWHLLLEQYGATVVNKIPHNLPLIKADAVQLWRVFENLVGNALKYNEPGLCITLNAFVEGDAIHCQFSDNGVGIAAEVSRSLFQPYTRGSQIQQQLQQQQQNQMGAGFGLGLYICRQILSAHGGTIAIDTQQGQGVHFCLTFPLSMNNEQ